MSFVVKSENSDSVKYSSIVALTAEVLPLLFKYLEFAILSASIFLKVGFFKPSIKVCLLCASEAAKVSLNLTLS